MGYEKTIQKRNRREIRKRRGTGNTPSGGKNKSTYDTKKQIQNYKTRLKASGRDTPKYDKSKNESTLGKTFNKVIDVMSRPQQAVVVGAKYAKKGKDFGEGFKRGLTGKEHYYGNEVMKDLGVKSEAGRLIGGVVFDTVTDPTSYTTLGVGKLLKGFTTGKKAVKTSDVAGEIVKLNKTRAVREAEKEVLDKLGSKTKSGLGKKYGMNMERVDDEIERYTYAKHTNLDPMEDKVKLEKAFAEKVVEADKKARKIKSGKGLSFMGQTIVSGDKLQDIGAGASRAIFRNTGKLGDTIDSARDTTKVLFDAGRVGRAGNNIEDVYKKISASAKGIKNFTDAEVYRQVDDFAKLTRGKKIYGANLDDKINDFISMNKEGLTKADLGTVLADTPAKRQAAVRLGLNPNATLDDVIEGYKKFYRDFATDESRAGLLRNIKDNYAPRIKSDSAMVRGGMTKEGRVNNAFAGKRNPAYDGKPIAEINADVRARNDLPDNFNLFETSALKSFATRAMSHNKIMADHQFVNEVLDTFGKHVDNTQEMYALWNNGYDMVIPRDRLQVFNIKSGGKIADEKVSDAIKSTIENSVSIDGDVMEILDEGKALRLLATPEGRKVITALPNGMAREFNMAAKTQIDDSMAKMFELVNNFNKVWKPLVTSLNINFHRRNLVSASFNNFLDLGARMFNPDTQRMAMEVMAKGAGGAGRAATKIKGKIYSADDIYKLMVKHNALSAFGMSEADNLTKGVMGEVNRTVKGKNIFQAAEGLGRSAGNRVEEYVRATNFIAHMKQGLSPAEAAEMVRKFQFDYTDLTKFEKQVKVVLPFYTWLRKNFPLQLEHLLDDPRAYLAVSRAGQEGADMTGIEYSDLPTYLQENGAIPYDIDKKTGRVKVLDMGLPVADLKTGARDILSMASPVIKALPELTLNQSFLTGAPLYKTEQSAATKLSKTGNGVWENLIQSIPNSEAYLRQHPEFAKVLDYAINNSGLVANVNKYGSTQDTANKVIQNPYDRYPNTYSSKNKKVDKFMQDRQYIYSMINMLRGISDPSMTRYFSEGIAKTNQEYEYLRQLADFVQAEKEAGKPVPTLAELRKAGIIPR